MSNVYRDNIIEVQRLLREVNNDWLYSSAVDKNLSEDSAYLENIVPMSGGTPYYMDLMNRLNQKMTEVSDATTT